MTIRPTNNGMGVIVVRRRIVGNVISKQPQAREGQVEDVNERKSSVGIESRSRVSTSETGGLG